MGGEKGIGRNKRKKNKRKRRTIWKTGKKYTATCEWCATAPLPALIKVIITFIQSLDFKQGRYLKWLTGGGRLNEFPISLEIFRVAIFETIWVDDTLQKLISSDPFENTIGLFWLFSLFCFFFSLFHLLFSFPEYFPLPPILVATTDSN